MVKIVEENKVAYKVVIEGRLAASEVGRFMFKEPENGA